MSENKRFRFAIDRGGTFTDVYCEILTPSPAGGAGGESTVTSRVVKLLSEDPSNYRDAPTEGIRRILEEETGLPHPRSAPVRTGQIDFIRMGTTVATNALLERKGERIALITTKGFGDLQLIGNQSRPRIFDLEIIRPDLLYEEVLEVDERVLLVSEHSKYDESEVVVGKSHERLFVEKALDPAAITSQLSSLHAKGIRSLAIVFLHSYTYSVHEEQVRAIAEGLGFQQISLSSEVMPMIRCVPRGGTTCVDAYLTPIIKNYLKSFSSGFERQLDGVKVSFLAVL